MNYKCFEEEFFSWWLEAAGRSPTSQFLQEVPAVETPRILEINCSLRFIQMENLGRILDIIDNLTLAPIAV